MGTRRDNRLSGGVGGQHMHAKQDHERRNHELLKRLASDAPSSFSHAALSLTKTSKSASLMSKSLTTELEKGTREAPGQDRRNSKTKGRKKAELDTALRSFQRQTSSSVKKMSSSVVDSMMDGRVNKRRDLGVANGKSPGKEQKVDPNSRGSSGGGVNKTERRTSQSSLENNTKRSDVFERLSKMDSNRGVSKGEPPVGNRTRDRSPPKSGRKSPLEKNGGGDRHQGGHKNGAGDALTKTAQLRKRDVSPSKNGNAIKRNASARRSFVGRNTRDISSSNNDNCNDDSLVYSEKLEQENVPESVNKDKDDPIMCSTNKGVSPLPSLAPLKSHQRASCPAGRQERAQGDEGTRASSREDINLLEATVQELASSAGSRLTEKHAVKQDTVNADENKGNMPGAGSKYASDASECGNKGKTKSGNSQDEVKSFSPVKCKSEGSNQCVIPSRGAPASEHNSISFKNGIVATTAASMSDVIKRVRARVNEGILVSNTNGSQVVDDDKDVCDADKAEEEREFYKISVQTRLVTYNNSTLVIKNTSKVGGGDCGCDNACSSSSSSDSEADSSSHIVLQTSSGAEAEAVPTAHVRPSVLALEAASSEVDDEASSATTTSAFTRSNSVRKKLSLFVNKGRNFLSDVYTATQSRLEQYTKAESPTSSTYSEREEQERAEVTCDSDSGYYSIPSSSTASYNPQRGADREDVSIATEEEHPDVSAATKISLSEKDEREGDCEAVSVSGEEGLSDDKGDLTKMGNLIDDVPKDETSNGATELGDIRVDEEWIKKNILCTCKCRDKITKSTDDETSIGTNSVIKDDKETYTEKDSTLSPQDVREKTAGETSCTESEADDEEEMCYCSCHDGTASHNLMQQLPEEVQELLDADHARMWWTITGNFGNILPIDWSKTYTRQQYLPVLNLNEAKIPTATEETDGGTEDDAEEEEEVAQDLDLHHLILNGLGTEPVKSAEEVIREIDDIMQEGSSSEDEGVEESSSSGETTQEPETRPLPPPLYADKLKSMSVAELNETYMELELVIRQYSETLINELALRDELEYEKELKNSFISLLLQVQNKRRNFNVEKKKQKKVGPNGTDPKYLTTVIPYDVGHGPPRNQTLQILIKILTAINEDSPTVPTLLTDYILKVDNKVLCPS